ncbi:hypothetical protein CYMTET_6797 [Cymbomonas tetramitiformis]|uniref:Uncharacterized protein n=1 Tax=Cymbomonas tetramitiformis TaxID=36881 RepID=A0AAE0LI30_9CHLO|nr:hypothetical protein CYMTET_6797 [Cymbomonas tetramitiformis]
MLADYANGSTGLLVLTTKITASAFSRNSLVTRFHAIGSPTAFRKKYVRLLQVLLVSVQVAGGPTPAPDGCRGISERRCHEYYEARLGKARFYLKGIAHNKTFLALALSGKR